VGDPVDVTVEVVCTVGVTATVLVDLEIEGKTQEQALEIENGE